MPSGVAVKDWRPYWAKPEEKSVLESPVIQAIRWLVEKAGMDDPQNQVMALMNPTEVGPSGGAVGALQKVIKGIRAYHGSPHDFDKFSLSKIGTGEGAQAYGHGLYFAESPATAQTYRDMLSGKTQAGRSLNWDDPVAVASMRLHQFSGDPNAAIAFIRGQRPNPSVSAINARAAQFADDMITAIQEGRASLPVDKGRMYEVNINADPDTLLDWDRPLSQQSEAVRNLVDDLRWGKADKAAYGSPTDQRKVFGWMDPAQQTGRSLINEMGSGPHESSALRAAGIPGLKYLDQGSRAAGEGTRNYTIWDDQLIEILRKWGLLPPVAGTALNPSEPQP